MSKAPRPSWGACPKPQGKKWWPWYQEAPRAGKARPQSGGSQPSTALECCSHDQTQRGSHQLKLDHGWAGGWPQVKPGNCPPVAVQPPLALPTSWTATLEWEEGEKETSGLEHELNPSQKWEFCLWRQSKKKQNCSPAQLGTGHRQGARQLLGWQFVTHTFHIKDYPQRHHMYFKKKK